jgi:hypothetical protein
MVGPLNESDISPTYTAVLMAVVAVIIGLSVLVLGLSFTEAIAQPAPLVTDTGGSLTVGPNGTQTVVLTHRGGDAVDVEALEIVVSLSADGRNGRLMNLPVRGTNLRPTSRYVRGDPLFATDNGSVDGVLASEYGGNGTWSLGTDIAFNLATTVDLAPTETVVVRVRHRPTNATIAEETLTPAPETP